MKEKIYRVEETTANRFFVITQWAYIYGFVGHGIMAVIFHFMGIPEMVLFTS